MQVASVGLSPATAAAQAVPIETYSASLASNDRAILEGREGAAAGFVRVHCAAGTDTILGATVVASHAGDLVSEITLAMQAKVGLGAVGRVIHPYPTQAEGVMGCGLGYIRANWQRLQAPPTAAVADAAAGPSAKRARCEQP